MTEAKPKSNAPLIIIIALVAGALLLVPCVLGGLAIVTGGLLINRTADPPAQPAAPLSAPTLANPAPPAEAPPTP